MRIHLSTCILIFNFIIIGYSSGNNNTIGVIAENIFAGVDSFFLDKVEKKELAGAITLIVKENQILHLKPYGYLDIEEEVPMNTDVIIPIGSMTKVITSIAVLQLVEDGKLQLDDPVEKYIPEFSRIKVLVNANSIEVEEPKVKLTIRDLMRHTSGIVYSGGNSVTDLLYREAGFRNWDQPLSLFVDEITKLPLACHPGTKWQYGYGHDILGYLIEVVSGKTLDRFYEERIFEPLGLKDTGFYIPKEKSARLSNLYEYKDNQLNLSDARNNSIYNHLPEALSGGGGWWDSYGGIVSSISDFRVMADMLLNFGGYNEKRILNQQTVEALIQNQLVHIPDNKTQYGLGVGVTSSDEAPGKTEEIYWAGAPYNTYFWVNYKENMIGILYTNTAPYGHKNMMNTFKKLVDETFSK